MPKAPAKRRRRRPEEAEGEILRAARKLLGSRPSHEVTVGAIMARTTLSRNSFYVYFRDRYDLIRRLVEPLASERDAIVAKLDLDAPPTLATARALFRELAEFYATHGRLLRALAVASDQDREAKRAWRAFTEPLVQGHVELMRREIRRGRITGVDPEPVARALIGMNLQLFFDQLLDTPNPDLDGTADTLASIWMRALYGVAPATRRPTARGRPKARRVSSRRGKA